MSDINFLKLYADASGLRVMLLANRLACETGSERALHDWVENILTRFVAFTRPALEAERRFALNRDPRQADDLGEDLYNHRAAYEDQWCDHGDHDIWDVTPAKMDGFLGILGEIHRSLKIYLSAWGLVLPVEIPALATLASAEFSPDETEDDLWYPEYEE